VAGELPRPEALGAAVGILAEPQRALVMVTVRLEVLHQQVDLLQVRGRHVRLGEGRRRTGRRAQRYERLGSQLGTRKETREITAGFAAAGLVVPGGARAGAVRRFGRLPQRAPT
jgi:hypothetical protein